MLVMINSIWKYFLATIPGSATLHAWQQLAQPHMGALLDHRPGVLTKGFCALAHEQEESEQDSWQLDQPEEDELSCDSFIAFSGEDSAPLDLTPSTSSSVCCNKNGDNSSSQSETLHVAHEKDEHVANMPLSFSRLSPASLQPSPEMNGHVDLKELQVFRGTTVDRAPGEGAPSWAHCTASTIPCNPGVWG